MVPAIDLVVAGGSNLVVADEGFPGLVVLVRTTGVKVESDIEKVELGDLLILKAASNSASQPAVLTGAGKVLMMDGFVQSFKVDNKGIKVGAQKKYSWELA